MKNTKMEKRRIFAILALVVLLFTGCSGSPATGKEQTSEQMGGITAAAPAPETSGEDAQENGGDVLPETNPPAGQDKITAEVEVLPSDSDFVRVCDYIPDIVVELKYATGDNFTGQIIYDFTDAYLRYGTVQKLMKVQEELKALNMGLKIWDAFRPVSAQFRLWEVYPDAAYVANPNTGFSSHSRGNTIDITLVAADGSEMRMPTPFDEFTIKADRDYSDCDEISAHNAVVLQTLMEKHGFKPYFAEWWHFSDTTSYDVEDAFVPPAN